MQRFKPLDFALTLGFIEAFALVILGVLLLFGVGEPFGVLIASVIPGFGTTFTGLIMGVLAGFLEGYVFGLLIALLYNGLANT